MLRIIHDHIRVLTRRVNESARFIKGYLVIRFVDPMYCKLVR